MMDTANLKAQAEEQKHKGDWEGALRLYEKLVTTESNDPFLWLSLGDVYCQLQKEKRAIADYQRAAELSQQLNDHQKVIVALRKILFIDKENAELYNKIGGEYLSLKLKGGAVREFLKVCDLALSSSNIKFFLDTLSHLVELLPENQKLPPKFEVIKNEVERAEEKIQQVKVEPEEIKPFYKLVEMAIKSNNSKKVVESYLALGRVLLAKGAKREAQNIYQKVLQREPANEEALEKILEISHSPEMTEGISIEEGLITQFNEFKELVWEKIDENYEDYFDLAMLFREFGLHDEAIIEFQSALKGGSKQLRAFEMLAVSFLEQGDTGLATEVLKQGLSIKKYIDHEYIGLHYNLGLAYERLGEIEKAIKEFEDVYVININYKDVAKKLKELEEKFKVLVKEEPKIPLTIMKPPAKEEKITPILPKKEEILVEKPVLERKEEGISFL
ncbi:MAG: tetratricopeptide repeat protein [Candidatus Edwardsbacteria bacterium]